MAAIPASESLPGRAALVQVMWVALVTACFLLARPYLGIVHDAIVYSVQALARAEPEIYRNDIFFFGGSQDRYTLFSPVFAGLGGLIGLGRAHFALTVIFLALFLAASYALVRALVPEGLRGFAMLLIAASGGYYGSQRVFRMGEPFVSPRPLAEAGTLLALVLLFSGRRAWSLALLAACALLHPLVALAGMIYWWIHALLAGERRGWLLAMALAPFAAAAAGLGPFRQLFETFDPEWLAKIMQHEPPLLFIQQWTVLDWSRVAVDLAALSIAARLCEGRARSAFQAAQLTAVFVIAATAIGGDLLQNVFITNVQPWRSLWIVHWLALASVPIAAARLWQSGEGGRLLLGLLLFALVTRGSPTSFGASLLAVALFARRGRLVLSPGFGRVALVALGAGALASWAVGEYRALTNPVGMAIAVNWPLAYSVAKPFPILLLAGGVLYLGLKLGAARVAAGAAGIVLLLSLAVWDQRAAFARYAESVEPGQHPFSRIVAPGELVWWESLPRGAAAFMPWIVMKRASYVSDTQHIGQHFSRERMMELSRRDALTMAILFQASLCHFMNRINPEEKCQPELEAAQELCRGAPELGYLVLEADYPGKWSARWSPPVEVGGRLPRYHLYACKALR